MLWGKWCFVRRLVGTGLVLATIAASGCAPEPPPPAGSGAAPSERPVVLTHGWQLTCGGEETETWQVFFDEAQRRGYGDADMTMYSYETCDSPQAAIAGFGRMVDDTLERTGATQVNVIAHSMGSLIARACIRFGSCGGKVDKFMSIAGANHGTVWANVCGLAFWSQSTCIMKPDGEFLAELNADDETWGDVDYVTMVSWCDTTIVPFTSTALAGALNVVTDRCLSHTDWRSDQQAADWVFDWFGGGSPQKLDTAGA